MALYIGGTAVDATAAEIDVLDGLDRGSIIYGNASSATTVLGQGNADEVLTSDGTDIAWAAAGGYTDQLAIHGTTGTGDSTSDAGATYDGTKLFQTTGQPGEGSLTNATYFAAAQDVSTFTITWDFGSGNSETITLYGLHAYSSSFGIDKWRFEASNDNSTWVILDTQSDQVDRLYNTYFQYYLVPWNTTAYRYFRWVVDAGIISGSYLYFRSISIHGDA